MKKVLSFCVLSVLLAVLSLGLKAQSGLVLNPANMPEVVLNQYDTIYISPNSECFDSLGLAESDRISIEWKVLYNGSVIPNDSLSYYFETFKFETRYDLGQAERWWGTTYTSGYCQNGNGYGSYPGANEPSEHLELGQQCEDPGHFAITLPGQNNPYQFDYFYVKFFKDAVNTGHRLVYNIIKDGDYEIIFSLARRCEGSEWDQVYVGRNEHYKVGGHQSEECGILSYDTLHTSFVSDITDYYRCVGDSLVLGNPAVTFTVSTDTTIDPGYDSVFYMGMSSCYGAIDSIVRFRVFFEDPSVPMLDTANSTLILCDSGEVSIMVTLTAADKCIWLDETYAVVDTLDAATPFTQNINANTHFSALGFNSASGCVSSDTLTVYAEVYASPNPVVTANPDTICENGTLDVTLDQKYDKWTWYHDGTDMNLDTIVYHVADVATTDAGWYLAEVSVNHTHSVYPTIDTIACSAMDSAHVTVFERPSVEWASFDGNAVADSLTVCPNDLTHVLVATITGGTAPYNNINWTGIGGTRVESYNANKSSDTLTITATATCGAEYTAGIDYAIDSNGCTLKDTIKITFFVNDTLKPTVSHERDTVSAQDYPSKSCQYIIPDVTALLTINDNCGIADTTQVPAAGELVTTDTIVIVTITDLCGNTAVDTIEVNLPVEELVIDTIIVTQQVLCAGEANGAISVTIEGGSAPYHVRIQSMLVNDSIKNADGTIDQTVFAFDGLIEGKWAVTVTDSNGCIAAVDTIDVAAPNVLTLTSSDWTDLTCFESNDGSFKFNVKQGTAPYEVKIVRTLGADADSVEMTLNCESLDTTVTMTDQKAGIYVISVVDGNNCTATVTDSLIQPDQLVLVGDTVLNHVKCFGDSTGNLAVTGVTGGTYPYYYAWVNNETGDTVSTDSVTGRILPAGIYTIYITDANNCTPDRTLNDTILGPERALNVVSIDAPVSDTCPRLHTYTFNATVEGGRPNYEFEWTFNNTVAQTNSDRNVVADTFNYIEATISCDTTFEIIFKVTDDSACVAQDTISFTIADTIAPTLAGQLDTLYIDGCEAADAGDTLNTIAKLQNAGLTISDNCTEVDALTVNFSEEVSGSCPYKVVRTYTVTDSCGLTSAEVKHVIYVQDTTAPTYTRPVDTILYLSDLCTVDTTAANVGLPTNLDDNCTLAADLVVSHRDEVTPTCGSAYNIVRYWRVVDACGNLSLSDSVQTIQVKDTTPPTFTTLPVSRTYPCDGSGDTALLRSYKNSMAGAAATDNCAFRSLVMNEDSVVQGCNSATLTYYFSFTATDECDNTTVVYATFNIIDTVPPTVHPADDVTMECSIDDLNTIVVNSRDNFTYDDACSHHAAYHSDSLSEFHKSCGSTGYYTHYVTITDSCQTTTASHTIRIVDNINPEFTVVPSKNSDVACDGMGNLDTLFSWLHSAKAEDACSGVIDSITIYYVNTSGVEVVFDSVAAMANLDEFGHIIDAWRPMEGNCRGFYRFKWKAVDSCDNPVFATEDFYISDNQGPVFTEIRTDDTVECGFNHDDFITWLKVDSAIDVCTNTKYPVTFDTVFHRACGHTGFYRVKWSVADTCGNPADPVYANWVVIDTTHPEITTSDPDNNLVTDTIYRPSDAPFTVEEPIEHFVVGMDSAASADFIEAFLNGDSIEDANGDKFVIRNGAGVLSIDECGWIREFHFNPHKRFDAKACWEEYNIEYTFTDDCGNYFTYHQVRYVVDTSAPKFNNIRDVRYLQGPDEACAPEEVEVFTSIDQANAYQPHYMGANTANITDYLPGTIVLDSVRSGSKLYGHPCDSVEVRYYTVSDQCGHDAVFTHTIYFRDTIAPILSKTELVDSIHQKSDCVTYTEIADENYDVNMLDKAWVENHFGITIKDCHDVTISKDGGDTYGTDDNYCPGNVITRRYKVTDDCGSDQHSSYFTLKLVVKDTVPPTVIPGAEVLLSDTVYFDENCNFTLPDVQFANYAAMKTWNGGTEVYNDCNIGDNSAVAIYDPVYAGTGCDSIVTFKYTVADSCGNMSRDTVSLSIHVLDTLAPTILVPNLTTRTVYMTNPDECDYTVPNVHFTDYEQLVAWQGAEVVNDCNLEATGNVTMYDTVKVDNGCTIDIQYKYAVEDRCGNISDTIRLTITVEDTLAPMVTSAYATVADTQYYEADCSIPTLNYWTNGQAALDHGVVMKDCNPAWDDDTKLVRLFETSERDVCTTVYTVRYQVKDACTDHLSDTIYQTILILDTLAPEVTATLIPDTAYMGDPDDCDFSHRVWTSYNSLPDYMKDGIKDCNLKDEIEFVSADTLHITGAYCGKVVYVNYNIQDSCGMKTAFNDTIYVLDTVAPKVTGTLKLDTVYLALDCSLAEPPAFSNTDEINAGGYVTIKDCNLVKELVASSIDTVGYFCPMRLHRTYTVYDSCGNSTQFHQYIDVYDTAAPTVNDNTLDTVTLYIAADTSFTVPAAYLLVDSLNVHGANVIDCKLVNDIDSVFCDTITDPTICEGSYVYREYYAVDSCGNKSLPVIEFFKLADTVAPWLDITLEATYDAERTVNDCEFIVPDFRDTIVAHYVDNWSSLDTFRQIPAAGYQITNFRDTLVTIIFGDVCHNMDTLYTTVHVPEELVIDTVYSTPTLCYGDSIGGSITVRISGGTGDFVYSYGNTARDFTTDATTHFFDTIPSALYTVTVTDANNCTATDTIRVKQPSDVILTPYVSSLETCDNGEVKVSVEMTEGTPNYFNVTATLLGSDFSVLSTVIDADDITSVTDTLPIDLLLGDTLYVAFAGEDSHGCQKVDTSAMIVVHPTYLTEQRDRKCFTDIASGYTWLDTAGNTIATYASTYFATGIDSIYVLEMVYPSAYSCDSTSIMYLQVTNNPYLKVRKTPAVYDETDPLSDVVEHQIYDTLQSSQTELNWEIFVDKNCMSCSANIKVSLQYEYWQKVNDTLYERMDAGVSSYFFPQYRTYYDNKSMTWYPAPSQAQISDACQVDIPSFYGNYSGDITMLNYFNLCWLDPTYDVPCLRTYYSQYNNLVTNGTFYENGRAHTIKLSQFRQDGDYKIVVKLVKRVDGYQINSFRTFAGCMENNLAGGQASTVDDVYATAEIFFHVEGAHASKYPQASAPIGGEIVFGSGEEAPQATVYPNPARDVVTVELTGFEGQTHVALTNANGKVLQNINVEIDDVHTTKIIKIETGDYAQGVYMVTARSKDAIITKRVVIIR